MGARGPKPDPTQAARGYPGRRRSKADRAAEQSAALAALLAPSAQVNSQLPSILQDAKYAAAAQVWIKLERELRRTHRLPVEAEFFFAQFCIYAQEWVATTEDLHVRGFSQNIKTVAGGSMERRRPKTLDRQQAFSNMLDLSKRFGLTPMDMYDLFKGQASVAATNPGLFGEDRKGQVAPAPAAPDEIAAQPEGRVGGLSRLRSAPPGERPN